MLKSYELKTAVVGGCDFRFFYIREKNDRNGNPRYKVFIIDPDGPAVHEIIFKGYESQLSERVASFIEKEIGVTVPF